MGAIFDAIQEKLTSAFQPLRLEIEDDSARHHGHAGARPEAESHFNVTIEAAAFAGAAKVARQRMVYRALAEELAGPLHRCRSRRWRPAKPSGQTKQAFEIISTGGPRLKTTITVNGERALDLDPRTTLLDALRETLHLTAKKGCDHGQCGAARSWSTGRGSIRACRWR